MPLIRRTLQIPHREGQESLSVAMPVDPTIDDACIPCPSAFVINLIADDLNSFVFVALSPRVSLVKVATSAAKQEVVAPNFARSASSNWVAHLP